MILLDISEHKLKAGRNSKMLLCLFADTFHFDLAYFQRININFFCDISSNLY